jgi:hypothetical protein
VLLPELRERLGRRRVAEDGGRGVAGDELDQNRHEAHHRPHDEQQDEQTARDVEQLALHQT